MSLLLAFVFREELIASMQTLPFSICIDGSNDQGIEKMYPILVRIYDVNQSKITDRFYDICTVSGRDSSKAESKLMITHPVCF